MTMGAYDGAEVCELVGTFILHQLASKYNKNNIGLYRDDGLAAFKDTSGPESARIKKDFVKVFKRNGLNLTIKCNMKIVDYLDVTFNLNDGSYKPFRKQIDTTYVHKDSGYDAKLQYVPPQENLGRRRNRKRQIIWYNPPYSKNVKTKIGEEFLKLTKKHFTKRHKFHKLFNKNNVKVSYSAMPSMNAVINGHNKKVLSEISNQNERSCNCRNPELCPVDGKCLTPGVMYQATVNSDLPRYEARIYKGITNRQFKERRKEHIKTFNNQRLRKDSKLSEEVWRIKDAGGTPQVTWTILDKCKAYTPALRLNDALSALRKS